MAQQVVMPKPAPPKEPRSAGALKGRVKPACSTCTLQMQGCSTLPERWTSRPLCAPAWLGVTEHVCAAQLFHGVLGLGQVGGGD